MKPHVAIHVAIMIVNFVSVGLPGFLCC